MSDWGGSGRSAFAAATFERFLQACARAADESYLLALKRLHDLVGTITELTQVVNELTAEGHTWWQNNARGEDDLRSEMVEFRQYLTNDFPELGASAKVAPPSGLDLDQHFDYQHSLARFDEVASKQIVKSRSLMPDRFENQSAAAVMRAILDFVTSRLARDNAAPDDPILKVRSRVHEFGNRVEWLHRERINQIRSSPFLTWLEVGRRAAAVNPEPQPERPIRDLNEIFDEAFDSLFEIPFEKILYGTGSNYANVKPKEDELEAFRAWRVDMDYRLAQFRDEVLLRLDLRRAVDTYVSRYAARCMWYRRETLTEAMQMPRRPMRQVERTLVADAAAYLFDQGFNVVTELSLGVIRLDLLGFAHERPLLLEAKVYRGNGRRVLVKGLRQLQDYASRVEAGFAQPESCLLVFRLGGRKLDPPRTVEIGGRSFRIVHVDLSAAQESGSRAPGVIPLAADDIAREVMATSSAVRRMSSRGRTSAK